MITKGTLPIRLATGKRPGHIVVFRDRDGKSEAIFCDLLGLKGKGGKELRPSCVQFESAAQELARPKFYRRFSVGLADLNEDQVKGFKRHSGILIVANQERSAPRTEYPPVDVPTVQAATGGAAALPPAQANLNWHLSKVGVVQPPASNRRVKVAILDSGIDLNHPDFTGRFVEMPPDGAPDGVHVGEVGTGNAVNYVAGESLQDLHGHGTHCAGLIAGPQAPNRGPRYGVGPDIDLLVAKVLNGSARGFDNNILEAIDWAADQGARIISLSLGTPRAERGDYDPLYEAAAKALLEEDPGVLIIASAGNESRRKAGLISAVGNPAACPSIMAVAAVGQDDAIATDSSGKRDDIGEINISAPGVAIYSSWAADQYRLASGTSSATPIVAGVAGLVLKESPNLNARQLRQRLLETARNLGPADDFGAGMVQLRSLP
jgi:subtilisin family serine protease